jgi:hypothetical protein
VFESESLRLAVQGNPAVLVVGLVMCVAERTRSVKTEVLGRH